VGGRGPGQPVGGGQRHQETYSHNGDGPPADALVAGEKGLGQGQPGESYILVDENATLNQMVAWLNEATGARLPRRHLPLGMFRAIAACEELRVRLFGGTPELVRGGVESFTVHWAYSSAKAQRELGFEPVPLREGLEKTYRWLQQQRLV